MKIRVLAFTGQDSYFFTMFNSKLLLCGGGFRKVLDAGRAFSDAEREFDGFRLLKSFAVL